MMNKTDKILWLIESILSFVFFSAAIWTFYFLLLKDPNNDFLTQTLLASTCEIVALALFITQLLYLFKIDEFTDRLIMNGFSLIILIVSSVQTYINILLLSRLPHFDQNDCSLIYTIIFTMIGFGIASSAIIYPNIINNNITKYQLMKRNKTGNYELKTKLTIIPCLFAALGILIIISLLSAVFNLVHPESKESVTYQINLVISLVNASAFVIIFLLIIFGNVFFKSLIIKESIYSDENKDSDKPSD